MQMYATLVLKCDKCGLRMQKCNVMESLYNVQDILSLFCDFYFDLILFGKHRLIVLLKEVIIHATLSYLLLISPGTPSECMFCLILTIWE